MNLEDQIRIYLSSLPEPKRIDLQELDSIIMEINPNCKLWFLDGKNNENKVVSNPNIGYGLTHIKYANGNSKEFYQIGTSANTTGISIYLFSNKDKDYFAKKYKNKLGKATITGYCIKFKTLKDLNIEILKELIKEVFIL